MKGFRQIRYFRVQITSEVRFRLSAPSPKGKGARMQSTLGLWVLSQRDYVSRPSRKCQGGGEPHISTVAQRGSEGEAAPTPIHPGVRVTGPTGTVETYAHVVGVSRVATKRLRREHGGTDLGDPCVWVSVSAPVCLLRPPVFTSLLDFRTTDGGIHAEHCDRAPPKKKSAPVFLYRAQHTVYRVLWRTGPPRVPWRMGPPLN